MNEEYRSLMENDTWDLVPLPKGRKLVRCKWVYRTKYASDGSVERHKAQLVVKGFSQIEGKKLKGYFAMSMVQFSSRYITVQGRLVYWLVSLIQIGPTTLMIR